ncbi:cytochrome c biogenesis CcdA family protein [Frigidibacter sp. ROC022]|uniref:cytochrome c biogenesis CcdA family protein n=1 Tax=Frigidibacter sp. ROC022 TaxID=2971796 RepID=UPI00215B4370|nr:cytochrome c biogenesis protein CcdA [Frigidibacter sp. ROC022]MCR8726206.1 cytochrome c biogenesis protein CcdA [Frigidibacter sp. ROC022]
MLEIGYGGAALAGLLSFLSPCVLPMVPFYLSYMAGLSMQELRGETTMPRGAQRRLVIQALAFALGVTSVFVLMGLGATALGQAFAQWRQPLAYVAAAVLAVFGLHFLGVIRVPFLYREARLEGPAKPSSLIGAYIMGLAFGFGWTPCVGPALAAILFVASASDTLWHGGTLLLVYGLAMTAPFVIAALFAKPFLGWVGRNRKYLGYVEKVMGAMLLLFAVLIATDSVNLIADWLIRNFDWSSTLK